MVEVKPPHQKKARSKDPYLEGIFGVWGGRFLGLDPATCSSPFYNTNRKCTAQRPAGPAVPPVAGISITTLGAASFHGPLRSTELQGILADVPFFRMKDQNVVLYPEAMDANYEIMLIIFITA